MGIFSCTEKQNSVTLHSEIRKTGAILCDAPHRKKNDTPYFLARESNRKSERKVCEDYIQIFFR